MATGAGFIETGARAGRAHVGRTALLDEIDAELARTGVVELCGSWGYGRTTLLCDYARTAHVRTPSRPVVRVDFASCDARAFLAGNREPMVQWVERRRAGEGTVAGAAPSDAAFRPDASDVERRVPSRFASDEVVLTYLHLAAWAPRWCRRLERGVLGGEVDFGELPLLVVDNLPPMGEERLCQFAEALAQWRAAGARVLLACTPSSLVPGSLLQDAFVVGVHMLEVTADELPLWARDLTFPEGFDVLGVTKGVPLLVDACRLVHGGDPSRDAGFLRACDRVLARCLDEPMCHAADRARWAMVMLGSGTLSDLASVGAPLRDDELGFLARIYPVFGIDLLKGTFSRVPLRFGPESESLARAVTGDEGLSIRCAEFLVARGEFGRAGELASLMSDRARMKLYGRQPDAFADAANGGCIERCMKAVVAQCGANAAVQPGLARIVQLHAIARDIPARMLPPDVVRATAGTSAGALHAVRCVLGFWRGFVGTGRPAGAGGAWGAEADDPDEPFACDERARTVEATVEALAIAGLQGNARLYAAQLGLLKAQFPFDRCDLASAVYAFHAVACGLLCDRAEDALAFVDPLAASAADLSDGKVDSLSGALLLSARALARLMVEKPSATHACAQAIEDVRRARRFSEEHVVEPLTAVLVFCEAVCLAVSGEERQAGPLFDRCRARWSAQGTMAGQLACCLGLAVADLAGDAVNQASVLARTAETLAQRMGLPRAVWLARLFQTVAAVRDGNVGELDRRLLEATVRQSAMHPNVSVTLGVELALLHAARGDVTDARDILQGMGLFGRPCACRLLVLAVRALGKNRAAVLEMLPRALRVEYDGLRPSSVARRRLASPGGARWCDDMLPDGFAEEGRRPHLLSVRLLGGLRIELNGRMLGDAGWGRRKTRDLLIALALYPESPVSRDSLLEMLWPGSEPTATLRNNLNTILSNLRSSLGQRGDGPEYILTQHDAVALNLELVDVDILRFERLGRSVLALSRDDEGAQIVKACGTLEGMFLTGFGPDLADLPRRVRKRVDEIEGLYIDCMVYGSGTALERGDVQLALWLANAAAQVAPTRSDVCLAADEARAELEARAERDREAPGAGGAEREKETDGEVQPVAAAC